MFKQSVKVIFLAIALISMPAMSAAELKVGVVNVSEIVQKMPQRSAIQVKLKSEFASRREEIISLEKKLTEAVEKLQRDSELLSAAQQQDAQKDIMNDQKDLKRLKEAFREDATLRENEETKNLLEMVGKAVDDIAKKEKYDLIIRREAAPFYVSDKVDLTDKVLEYFKKKQG